MLAGGVAVVVAVLVAVVGLRAPAVRQALGGEPAPAAVASGPATDPSPATAVTAGSAAADPSPADPTPADPTPAAPQESAPADEPAGGPAEPTKVEVPQTGKGGYRQAKTAAKPTHTKGRLIRFDVRVEKNMPFDAKETAQFIAGVLDDDRSWTGSGSWRFELVDDPAKAELHAWVVSPATTDRKCYPLLTRGQVSCQSGTDVVLNAERWGQGAAAFGDDLRGYREYLVNHEFGHYLGYQHVGCPGRGKKAPVMMQQTKGVGTCRTNPWPAPGRG